MKITKRAHAFKGYASTYNVEIFNFLNPELQLKDTESPIKNKLKKLLSELKGFKFVTTLFLVFKTLFLVFKKIQSEDKTKYDTFYSNSNAQIIINEIDIDDMF